MTILLKPDHFAFLKNKPIEHYSGKLATLAQANDELTFKDDNEIKDFMEAVISEDFILGDTGKFYINMKQPVNVINGTHEEEFLQLEKRSSINPNTKVKEVDFNIAFETFENARFFGSLNSNHELDREGFSQLIVGITNLADDLQDLSELLLEISDEIDGISGIE